MKKIYILLFVGLVCLTNIGYAQQYGTPGYYGEQIHSRQSALAEIWAAGKYGGTTDFSWSTNTLKSAKKPRIHYSYLLAVENTVYEATGLTTLRWADGSSYVGLTDRGAMFVGTMTYADGSKYIGKWERNQPNGEGTFINPEGVAFTGKFKDGEPHGKCIIQDTDGQLYKARWYYGKLRKRSIKPLKEE